MTTAGKGYGSILVNGDASWPRQRFTIAHELGHFLHPEWSSPPEVVHPQG